MFFYGMIGVFCTWFSDGNALALEVVLGLRNGAARVISRITLFITTVICDSSNYLFRIVTTRQRTFGVGPVMLRLAQRGTGSAMPASCFLTMVSGSIL